MISISCDENQRRYTTSTMHLCAELQAVQAWKSDIQDEAINVRVSGGKLFSRCKEPNLMAQRAKQSIQRGPYVDVVIDDGKKHVDRVYHRWRPLAAAMQFR